MAVNNVLCAAPAGKPVWRTDPNISRRSRVQYDGVVMLWLAPIALALVIAPAQAAPAKEAAPMPHHAAGTFTVDVKPLTPTPADGVARYSINKQLHGGLEATSQGEMFAAGDYKLGAAGYVAIEVVTGSLDGHRGSFVLQHSATLDASGQHMTVTVTPGSGTAELKGLTGTFVIKIEGGKHSYEFDYTLP